MTEVVIWEFSSTTKALGPRMEMAPRPHPPNWWKCTTLGSRKSSFADIDDDIAGGHVAGRGRGDRPSCNSTTGAVTVRRVGVKERGIKDIGFVGDGGYPIRQGNPVRGSRPRKPFLSGGTERPGLTGMVVQAVDPRTADVPVHLPAGRRVGVRRYRPSVDDGHGAINANADRTGVAIAQYIARNKGQATLPSTTSDPAWTFTLPRDQSVGVGKTPGPVGHPHRTCNLNADQTRIAAARRIAGDIGRIPKTIGIGEPAVTVTFPALRRNTNRTTPGRDPGIHRPATRTLTEPASPLPRASLEIWLRSFDGQAVGAYLRVTAQSEGEGIGRNQGAVGQAHWTRHRDIECSCIAVAAGFAENIAVIEDKGSGAHHPLPHRAQRRRARRDGRIVENGGATADTHIHRAGVADSCRIAGNLGFVIQIKTPARTITLPALPDPRAFDEITAAEQ